MFSGIADRARPRRMRRAVLLVLSCGFAVMVAPAAILAAPGDLEAIRKAADLDTEPEDAQAVAAVCTSCHDAAQFLATPRSGLRWQQVFQQMADEGASGT